MKVSRSFRNLLRTNCKQTVEMPDKTVQSADKKIQVNLSHTEEEVFPLSIIVKISSDITVNVSSLSRKFRAAYVVYTFHSSKAYYQILFGPKSQCKSILRKRNKALHIDLNYS